MHEFCKCFWIDWKLPDNFYRPATLSGQRWGLLLQQTFTTLLAWWSHYWSVCLVKIYPLKSLWFTVLLAQDLFENCVKYIFSSATLTVSAILHQERGNDLHNGLAILILKPYFHMIQFLILFPLFSYCWENLLLEFVEWAVRTYVLWSVIYFLALTGNFLLAVFTWKWNT